MNNKATSSKFGINTHKECLIFANLMLNALGTVSSFFRLAPKRKHVCSTQVQFPHFEILVLDVLLRIHCTAPEFLLELNAIGSFLSQSEELSSYVTKSKHARFKD